MTEKVFVYRSTIQRPKQEVEDWLLSECRGFAPRAEIVEDKCYVSAKDANSCQLIDQIKYRGSEEELKKSVAYKHELAGGDLALFSKYALDPQRILVSGSQGFVGKALCAFLRSAGHTVVCLRRSNVPKKEKGVIFWDPEIGLLSKEDFEGFDAVIHLAGENIAKGRWSKKKKDKIFQSRVRDTWLLSQVLLRLNRPPKAVICASAIGYYGNRDTEMLTEKSLPGSGFLAGVCQRWEEALVGIKNRGSRVVNARFGIILGYSGGMLRKIPPVILGKKEEIMPWIALDDVLGAIYHSLALSEIEGPVNFTSPYPVTQLEFVNTVHKKAYLTVPPWLLKLLLGEMAQELLLSSTLAYPEVLIHTDYTFRYPMLRQATKHR